MQGIGLAVVKELCALGAKVGRVRGDSTGKKESAIVFTTKPALYH